MILPKNPTYYISIRNDFSTYDIEMFIKDRNNEHVPLLQHEYYRDEFDQNFSVSVYVNICKEYTLIKTVDASIDSKSFTPISNADIPNECLPEDIKNIYYVAVKNDFSLRLQVICCKQIRILC